MEWLVLGAFGRHLRAVTGADEVNRREALHGAIVAALTSGIVVSGALGEKVTAAARKPDYSTADHLAGLMRQLRDLDFVSSAGALVDYSKSLVDLCKHALANARPQDQADIGRVLAEAAMEHWWQVWQAGDGRDVAGAFQQATALAIEWDQPALVSHLLGFRSAVVLRDGGDATEALRLARLAQEPRWCLSAAERSRAANWEIRAHALAGHDEGMRRALDVREGALNSIDPATEPPWLSWLVEQVEIEKADCQLMLDGVEAVTAMDAAVRRLPQDWTRSIALYRGRIACVKAEAGDIDGAVQEVETIAGLDAGVWSLGELTQLARRPHVAPLRTVLADHGLLSA